jgi:hypothetical protein
VGESGGWTRFMQAPIFNINAKQKLRIQKQSHQFAASAYLSREYL